MVLDWLASDIELSVWYILVHMIVLLFIGYFIGNVRALQNEQREIGYAMAVTHYAYIMSEMLKAGDRIADEAGIKPEYKRQLIEARDEAERDLQAIRTISYDEAETSQPISGKLARLVGLSSGPPPSTDADVADARERIERVTDKADDTDTDNDNDDYPEYMPSVAFGRGVSDTEPDPSDGSQDRSE